MDRVLSAHKSALGSHKLALSEQMLTSAAMGKSFQF